MTLLPAGRYAAVVLVLLVALGGCATQESSITTGGYPVMTAAEGRARVEGLLPAGVNDRNGWATDIYAAIAALGIPPTLDNFCAVIAVIEQESGFHADPSVPALAAIASRELERQRERAGIPKLVLDGALALPSRNGKTYRERLDAAHTERELSEIYEDFIGRVPLATTFLAQRNPVRTGGPMQVSVEFAEQLIARKPYPYSMTGNVRHEVFTRRGGVYFGVAHLLDYPARYDRLLYRFADYNAGWYASRNAAFQNALTQVSGIPLTLDGDLLRYDGERALAEPSSTELAARVVGPRIRLNESDIRRDLERAKTPAFEQTSLYRQVFAMADRAAGKALARAVLPQITLHSPKITRNLTTEWFARRVEQRFQTCEARAAQ